MHLPPPMIKSLNQQTGLTLIESLITVSILGILTVATITAWGPFISKKRTKYTIETIQSFISHARQQSMVHHKATTVSFRIYADTPNHWCYGLSDNGDCDCRIAHQCLFNNQEVVSDNKNMITTSIKLEYLSGQQPDKFILFNGFRGTTESPGSITVSNHNYSASLTVNPMGYNHICSNQISGYPQC